MIHEAALQLSKALARAGYSHSVEVGHHEKYAAEGPSEFPQIHCRVDLAWPRGDGRLAEKVAELEAIGRDLGLILTTSGLLDSGGLTFTAPPPVGTIWHGIEPR